MRRVDLINGVAVLLAVAAAILAPLAWQPGQAPALLSSTETMVVDATATAVPALAYQRIVSADWAADGILYQLVGAERLVVVSGAARDEPVAELARPTLGWPPNLETVLAAEPDLVVWPATGATDAAVARLREAGVTVFVLARGGEGVAVTARIRRLAQLVAADQAGAALADDFARRLAPTPASESAPRALVLTTHGGQWFGGTAGTSYASLIAAAGWRDAAADAGYQGWPGLALEEIAALDPDLILVRANQVAAVRTALRGLGLRVTEPSALVDAGAANGGDGIIGVPSPWFDHPGLGMAEAADWLRTQIR